MDTSSAAWVVLAASEANGKLAGHGIAPAHTFLGAPSWTVAVAVSVGSSALLVLGLVLQKRAVVAPRSWYPRIGEFVLSPEWGLGFLIGIVMPIPVQIFAYTLAPMSLITPLSGITVAINTVLAPRMLGERLQPWPDLPASFLILVGTMLTTMAGAHKEMDYTFPQLLGLWVQAAFVAALVFLVAAMSFSIGVMTRCRSKIEASAKARPANPMLGYVLLPALVAAGCGCITNIALKGFGELLSGRAAAFECGLWAVMALCPALVQLNYINRGLRLYQQTVFFPVYNALLVLTNTACGLIFYREYNVLLHSGGRTSIFSFGILAVMSGVCLFTLRGSDSEATPPAKRVLTEDAGIGGVDAELGLSGRRGNPLASPLAANSSHLG